MVVCNFSEIGKFDRLYCKNNNMKVCKYQKYCNKDHVWKNSDQSYQCEFKQNKIEQLQ